MARTYQFLIACGVNPEGIRFRQHLQNEMAHYAKDCWDAEILMSHGWVECVGIADRSAFDLNAHAEESKKNLTASVKFAEPKQIEALELTPNKAALGKTYKKDAQKILKIFETASEDEKKKLVADLEANGTAVVESCEGQFEITPEMVNPKTVTKTLHEEKFYPSVIEPSFGIGRIMTGVLEHSFRKREKDADRHYLSFPPLIAPVKCSILPLSNDPRFLAPQTEIRRSMTSYELSTEVDNSSQSIGRRYARTDEIGIPFAVTIDFQTLTDNSVTLREENSMD